MADNTSPGISEAAVNAGVDAITALVDGGKLKLYNGAMPPSVDTAIVAQTLLAEPAFAATAFGLAGAGALEPGVAKADTITADADANATGAAQFFRACAADGTAHWQGSVGPVADPQVDTYDLYMNSTAIQEHAAVGVSEFYYTGQGYVAP
jgi:hypothetical protein